MIKQIARNKVQVYKRSARSVYSASMERMITTKLPGENVLLLKIFIIAPTEKSSMEVAKESVSTEKFMKVIIGIHMVYRLMKTDPVTKNFRFLFFTFGKAMVPSCQIR